jgi:type IV pilus assembly protein PilQ
VKVEGCGEVKTIAVRALDTGDVRVRDGQTLILTGVISDQDIQAVRKWPILGDIPFVGQFFRDSSNNRKKRELVIMVTPRIVDDQQGGTYGYGYQPATADAQRFMAN